MSGVSGQPYERLVGRYALYGEIAAGGMATVHFGRLLGPVGFSRTVAIKRLHAQFAKDPEFAAMFLDEARLAGRIQHPNVVSTLDVVSLEGELFLVMEYVQGESLARLLGAVHKRGAKIPAKIIAAILTGVLYGLHAAHEATDEQGRPLHIVHRDVSPQNILVGADGTARVLDFGVAKAVGRIQSTREGEIKGKLAYMAPEQMKGMPMDRRSDIYGAAVVLWEALTVRRLFDGEHAGVVFNKVMNGEIVPPSQFVPGIPKALDDIVLRGLARDYTQRYPTAHAMAIDLEERVGIASPRQVAEWMADIAGDSLSKRAIRIKEIESISTPPPAPIAGLGPRENAAAAQGSSGLASLPSAPALSRVAPLPPVAFPVSAYTQPGTAPMPLPPPRPPPPPQPSLPFIPAASSITAPPPSSGPSSAQSAPAFGINSSSSRSTVSVVSPSPAVVPAGSQQSSRLAWIVGAVLFAVLLGSGFALMLFRSDAGNAAPGPQASAAALPLRQSAQAVSSSVQALGSSAAAEAAPDAGMADASGASSAGPSAPSSTSPSPRTSAAAGPGTPTAKPQSTSKPASRDCGIPYYIDSKGIQRLKPECL